MRAAPTPNQMMTPGPSGNLVGEARRAIVDHAREGWINKLIDLSRRNNLLYFRDLRTGTLDLSHAPAQASAALLNGEQVPLTHLVPRGDVQRSVTQARAIQQRALLNLEEKGIQTLFLALGMASWPPADDGRAAEAAVLLLPVAIEVRGREVREAWLRRAGDVQVNLVLLHVLDTQFGCTLTPEQIYDPSLTEDGSFIPDAAFTRLREATRQIEGFSIHERAVLSNFSFQKLAMVKDLRERRTELAEHQIIAAIAGDTSARNVVQMRRTPIELTTLDRALPEQEFLILDADASQQRVITAVLQGHDGVIQGPPGTGKSQTIANVIAALVAQGKRILFVAEKRAALEVVYRRLHSAGLGHLALDLHGADVSRREVLRRFGESLMAVRDAPLVVADELHQRFAQRRAQLNAYVWQLHIPRQPSQLSVYELQGRLLLIPPQVRARTRWRGAALQPLDTPSAAMIRDLLIEAAGFGGLFVRSDPSPWTGAHVPSGVDAQHASDLVARLLHDRWPALDQALTDLVEATGLFMPTSLEDATALLQLLDELSATVAAYSEQLFSEPLTDVLTAFAPAGKGRLATLWAWCTSGEYRTARRRLLGHRRTAADTARLYVETTAAWDQLQRWQLRSKAATPPQVPPGLDEARALLTAVVSEVGALAAVLQRSDLYQISLEQLLTLLQTLAADTSTLYRLPRLHEIEQLIRDRQAEAIIDELRSTRPAPARWPQLFEHAWLASCLDAALSETPALAGFYGRTHDRFVQEFVTLDQERLRVAAQRLRRTHAERAITAMNAYPDQATLVRREAEKKTRHLPLRRLMAQAPEVLTALRPCWMASPLSVSQLLEADQAYFDVVVFDEASQVPPEDAIAALLRGKQVIVAGDKHQLPPTTFFAASDTETEEAEQAHATEGFESVLDLLSGLFEPWSLDWHYRSRDETLIAFANQHIYGERLVTFPHPSSERVLSHVLVRSTPNEADLESNTTEVQRVVDLVLDHARQRPDETLGVITMGIKHAQQLEAALDARLRGAPELEAFFDQQRDERFFIKNLERVQGDERDAIILSIGYGKSADGKLPYRFGPLLLQGGERRLNVAITRARQRMTLVSSFAASDMDPDRSRARGVELLRLYLHYAAQASVPFAEGSRTAADLSPFEQDLHDALLAAGVPIVPRVGVSQARLDFAVRDPAQPGQFLLAIEGDGAVYHQAPTARDRDRLRQQHLDTLDWQYLRIWSVDWYQRRDAEIARVLASFSAAVQRAEQRLDPTAASPGPATGQTIRLEPAQVSPPPTHGPRPAIGRRENITDYRMEELIALIRWITSDGRLRTDDEIVEEMVQELGFRRRGPRIMATLHTAVTQAKAV